MAADADEKRSGVSRKGVTYPSAHIVSLHLLSELARLPSKTSKAQFGSLEGRTPVPNADLRYEAS